MGRSKSLKFIDNELSRYVIQPGKEIFETIRGNWNSNFFRNDNEIVLELACGRGEYTIGLSREFPHKNFIGIDFKGARIWAGRKIAETEKRDNVAFLRTHIQNIEQFFVPGEVSEMWIIHPDPRPKKSDRHRRLTHPRFLEIYKRLLKNKGTIRLKTDNTGLFNYTLEILNGRNDISELIYTDDLYASDLNAEHFGITTRYEALFSSEGHAIKYLRFSFR